MRIWALFAFISIFVFPACTLKTSSPSNTQVEVNTVTISATSPILSVGTSQKLSARGSAADNQLADITSQVSWQSSCTCVAISTTGVTTGVSVGVATITAKTPEGITSNPLTITVVAQKPQLYSVSLVSADTNETIEAEKGIIVPNGTFLTINAVATYEDQSKENASGAVRWMIDDTSILSIQNGTIKALSAGTTHIHAVLHGVESKPILVKILDTTLQNIQLSSLNTRLIIGSSLNLIATGVFSGSYSSNLSHSVQWKTIPEGIVTIQDGVVTAKAPWQGAIASAGVQQSVPISVIASFENVTSEPLSINVVPPVLETISIYPAFPILGKNQSQGLSFVGMYSNGQTRGLSRGDGLLVAVANPHIISLSSDHSTLTGIGAGSTALNASIGNITAAVPVTVTNARLTALLASPAQVSLPAGFQQRLQVIGSYSDGSLADLTSSAQLGWSSDDDTIASAGLNGILSFHQPGLTTVLASALGITSNFVQTTVTPASLLYIVLTPPSASFAVGSSGQFHATGTYSDGSTYDISQNVSWVSSNTAAAYFPQGSPGLLNSLAAGQTNVTANLQGVTSSATLVTITPATLETLSLSSNSVSVGHGLTTSLSVMGQFSDGSIQDLTASTLITWSSSDEALAGVTSKGVVSGRTPGNVTITATAPSFHLSASANVDVLNASLQSLIISPDKMVIPAGESQIYVAQGIFSDGSIQDLSEQVAWYSASNVVASFEQNATLKGNNLGDTAVFASLGAFTSNTLSVNVSDPVLKLIIIKNTAQSTTLATGNTQQLSAMGTFSDGSIKDLTNSPLINWSSGLFNGISISPEGVVSGVTAGGAIVQAVSADGNTQSNPILINVVNAIPQLLSIHIAPQAATLALGTQTTFSAIGSYDDGSQKNISGEVTWTSSNTGVVPVVGGLAFAVQTGTAVIKAALGNRTSTDNTSATVTAVNPMLQRFEIIAPNTQMISGTQMNLTAIGFFSDGSSPLIQPSWQPSSAAATVDANGVVTALNLGNLPINVTIKAQYLGQENEIELKILPSLLQDIQVLPSSALLTVGDSQDFTAIGTYSNGTTQNLTTSVVWTSLNSHIRFIGHIATGVSTGNSLATATLGGRSGSSPVIVTPARVESVRMIPITASFASGLSQPYAAMAAYSDGTQEDITSSPKTVWLSNDSTIAKSLGNGWYLGGTPGTTHLYVQFAGFSAQSTAIVTPSLLESLTVQADASTLIPGSATHVRAIGNYSDGSQADLTSSVNWVSSNAASASVDTTGLIVGRSEGQTNVTANLGTIASNSVLETVTAATLQSLSLSPNDPSFALGSTQQFTATGLYSDGTTHDLTNAVVSSIVWGTDNTDIATASNMGAVKGLQVGHTVLTVFLNGHQSSTNITVTPAILQNIAINPPNATLAAGTRVSFTALGLYSDSSTQDITPQVLWTTSDPSLAAFDNAAVAGSLKALRKGGVSVSASYQGIPSVFAQITVNPPNLMSISIPQSTFSTPAGQALTVPVMGTYSDGSVSPLPGDSLVWVSSNPSVAAVDTTGSVLGTRANATGVTITAKINGFVATTKVIITGAVMKNITISPTNVSIMTGSTQKFQIKALFTDGSQSDVTSSAVWTFDTPNILSTTTTKGLFKAIAPGNTCSQSGSINGSTLLIAKVGTFTASAAVSVTPATLKTIAITPTSATLKKDATLSFTAKGTYMDASTCSLTNQVTWNSSLPQSVSIQPGGLATGLATSGTTSIWATYQGATSPKASVRSTP